MSTRIRVLHPTNGTPLLVGLVCAVCLVALCTGTLPAAAGEEGGADSPQAVVAAAKAAGEARDVAGLVRLTAPSERPMLALSFDMGVGMMLEFWEGDSAEAMKKRYADIQAKYGVKTPSEDEDEQLQVTSETSQEEIDAHIRKRAQKLYGGIDLVGYLPEIMAIMLEMPEMADQPLFPDGELADLTVQGDTASGTVADKTISFVQENGRWYLSADAME